MPYLWTIENIEKFITLLRAHPCIWNVDESSYYDVSSKDEAFSIMSKNMNIPKEALRVKYKCLRAQYVRVLRNPEKRNSPRRWIHFDALKYLGGMDNIFEDLPADINTTEVKTIQELDEEDETFEEVEDNIKPADISNIIEEEEAVAGNTIYDNDQYDNEEEYTGEDEEDFAEEIVSEIPAKRKRLTSSDNGNEHTKQHKCNKRSTILVMKPNNGLPDEYTAFGNYVANELRSLEDQPLLQKNLKCAVLKAIYEVNKTNLS